MTLILSNNKKRLSESQVYSKLSDWKDDLREEKPVLYKQKTDITLFSNYFLRNPLDPAKKFVPFFWQDVVFNDPSKRRVVCTSRQIGKTTVAAIEALHFAFFHNDVTVLVLSRTFPQAIEVVKRMKDFMNKARFTAFKALQPEEKESRSVIRIWNRKEPGQVKSYSRIVSVVASDAARGYTADFVICDEAAFWENGEYVFKQAVLPTVKATKGKVLVISTPNGQQGFFWQLFNSPYWNAYQFDWRASPDNAEEEMKIEKDGSSYLEFASEYEADFVSPRNAYFTASEIKRATENFEWGAVTGPVAIGVDLGKHHDPTVIYVGCIDNPNSERRSQVIRVVERIVKPLGTKYSSIVEEIKDLFYKYQVNIICVDATGVGEGPGEALELEGLPVELVKFSIQKKATIYSSLKVLMQDPIGRIKIPEEKELTDQLGWMMYEYGKKNTSSAFASTNIKIFPVEGGHDDEVDALALLAYGLTNLMEAPASLEIVSKTSVKDPKAKKSLGKHLFYCQKHDEYHWDKCSD